MSVKERLALDAVLFVAIAVAFAPSATGITVHEWLSLALAGPALFHLIINWDWVTRTTARLFGRIRAASRANLAVDAVLFVSAVTVMLSGMMVSRVVASALGVTTVATAEWVAVHSLSATATVLSVLAHLALHAPWIARALAPRRRQPCAS